MFESVILTRMMSLKYLSELTDKKLDAHHMLKSHKRHENRFIKLTTSGNNET